MFQIRELGLHHNNVFVDEDWHIMFRGGHSIGLLRRLNFHASQAIIVSEMLSEESGSPTKVFVVALPCKDIRIPRYTA